MSAAPAPVKSSKQKAAAKPMKPAPHHKYNEMVKEAISSLKETGGSSRQDMLKYIMKNYSPGAEDKAVNSRLSCPSALEWGTPVWSSLKALVHLEASVSVKQLERCPRRSRQEAFCQEGRQGNPQPRSMPPRRYQAQEPGQEKARSKETRSHKSNNKECNSQGASCFDSLRHCFIAYTLLERPQNSKTLFFI